MPPFENQTPAARSLACILVCLAGTHTPAAAGEDARSRELQQTLAAYNQHVRAPAWAAAVIHDGDIVAIAGVGVRDLSSRAPLDVENDQFHWGSIGKSVTATMLAGLVKEGRIGWDTTLAKALPDIPMRAEYRGVSIAQLLNHRADLPPYTQLGPSEAQRFRSYTGTDVQKRDAFVRDVLQEMPPPRSEGALVYSNAGPAVAAHAAQVATGSSWEALVRRHVFERIGMPSAGFGLPATIGPDQPRGHAGRDAEALTVMGAGPMPGNPLLDAAGNIRSTVRDLAAYARAHLLALKGSPGPLDGLDVRALHRPPDDDRRLGPEGAGYAMGWGLRREGSQVVHWHNGSAGQFFAQVDIFPDDDLAIVIMCNAGFPGRDAPELVRLIRSLYVK